MKFQTMINHMRYSIFKKNAFKNDTNIYKDEKNLDMSKYILDFKQLPTSVVYAFDERLC